MESATQMTKREILEWIGGIYTRDTRSVKPGGGNTCLYNGPNGRHCAFAMMVAPEDRDSLSKWEGNQAEEVLEIFGQEILQPRFRGHEEAFYEACQDFHDNASNWDHTGLTQDGRETIDYILERFKS